MGNSATTGFSIPKKLSWGSQKEDTVRMQDLLVNRDDDLWSVTGTHSLSMEEIDLAHNYPFAELPVQESNKVYSYTCEILNPAFVGTEDPEICGFTVNNSSNTTEQQEDTQF